MAYETIRDAFRQACEAREGEPGYGGAIQTFGDLIGWHRDVHTIVSEGAFIEKRHISWAALTRKVYEVDALRCPDCGGEMKIISFIDKCQADIVEKILRHCGLGKEATCLPAPVVNRGA